MNTILQALSDNAIASALVSFATALLTHLGIHLSKKVPSLNVQGALKALVTPPPSQGITSEPAAPAAPTSPTPPAH